MGHTRKNHGAFRTHKNTMTVRKDSQKTIGTQRANPNIIPPAKEHAFSRSTDLALALAL